MRPHQPVSAPASGSARRLLPVRLLALLALVLLPSAGLVAFAGPASAATKGVSLTGSSVTVEIDAGDRVMFTNEDAGAVSHRVTGNGYDSDTLLVGSTSTTGALSSSTSFTDTAMTLEADGTSGDDTATITVVVTPAPTASPTPTSGGGDGSISDPTSPATKDTPSTSGGTPAKKKQPTTEKTPEPTKSPAKKKTAAEAGASPRSATAASPVPTGGTGYALQPDLDTGALLMPGGSGTGPGGPAPAVAPVLPDDPALLLGQGSPVGVQADQQLAARGALPGSLTVRRYGLPIALAVVALAGVGSLLVRVLLAEPAARRTTASTA